MKKHIQLFYKKVISTEGRETLAKNFFSLTLWQIIILILPLVTIPYLIRVIGPGKFGLIAFAQSLIQYFAVLTDYGFNFSATRQIAIHRSDTVKVSSIVSEVLAVKFIFLILNLLLLAMLILLVPKFRQDWPLYLVSFGALCGNVFFPVFFFQGIEKMKYILGCNLIYVLFVPLIFLFVRAEEDFLRLPMINASASIAVGAVALGIAYFRFGLHFYLPNWKQIKLQLKDGWHVFISQVATSSFNDTRTFAMGLFTTNQATGYFAIAERMTTLVLLFPKALLLQAAYPRLSMLHSRDPGGVEKLIKRFQRIITGSYLVTVPLFFLFAPSVTRLVCGFPYPEVVLSFRILLLGVFLVAANVFRVNRFLITGQSHIYAKIAIICGAAGVFLTFFFTYFFSFRGAACSFVAVAILAFILTLREARAKA